jgi:mono/diheme cytochrome c family protein
MMRKLINVCAAICLLGAVAIAVSGLVLWSNGFSSRPKPSHLESSVAMKAYDSSVPNRFEAMKNPLEARGINLIEAGGHYEEHCAVCHADNGGGEPRFHGIMYPRPTDLRSDDTQEMSDGELYWVIKNGVRWSGMPAFGEPGDDDEHVWKIVAYVRHLPKLTPQEQQEVMHQSEEPMDHDESPDDHSH